MRPKTAELWAKQDRHLGDRWRLFTAVTEALRPAAALYAGSYVDVAPSFVMPSVTYIDCDKRAQRFFGDVDGVHEIIAAHDGPPEPAVYFVHADYTTTLGLPHTHFDLLISLYAGFVSEYCTQHLKIGGTLLVNPSHGDAAMAAIDERYRLSGVVSSRDGGYSVSTVELNTYLIPKRAQAITAALLHDTGRGIAYTKSPFAYLFTRVA